MPACSVATVLSADSIAACLSGRFLSGDPACMADAITALPRACPTELPFRALRADAIGPPQPSVNHPHLRFGKYGAPAPRKQW